MAKIIQISSEEKTTLTLSRVSTTSEVIYQNSKGTKFKDYANSLEKISTLDGDLVGRSLLIFKLKVAFDIAFQMVGIKKENYPNAVMFRLLCEDVIQLFPTFVVEDIIHAFRCAITGKTDANTDYQMANLKFVFPILSEYRIYKSGILNGDSYREKREEKARHLIFIEKRIERASGVKKWLISLYFAFLQGEEIRGLFDVHYDYLMDLGLITLTPRCRKKILECILERKYNFLFRLIGTQYDFMFSLKPPPFSSIPPSEPIWVAKRIAIVYQFKKFKAEGITPEDLGSYMDYVASYIGHHTEKFKP